MRLTLINEKKGIRESNLSISLILSLGAAIHARSSSHHSHGFEMSDDQHDNHPSRGQAIHFDTLMFVWASVERYSSANEPTSWTAFG